ncbi:MAG TPA: ABC transporter ATP-binding protein [Acidimicrobiales bacterium]|nr:ABC transporter ATP-binding protein [Acidimicrobiales bacterium]
MTSDGSAREQRPVAVAPGSIAAAPAVELKGISKRFPGVVANDDVNLVVQPGEIHAIVGENGAGKSTLMKILYGMQRPDTGEIRVNGEPMQFKSPKDAIAAGIGMVHQHFMLADNLTVLENVILGSEPTKGIRIDFRTAYDTISDLGRLYGLDVDPNELVETLEVGERQRVEIIKVLYRGAKILILDEPTAALVPQEVEELFRNLRDLKAQGSTVIFISHKLDEVLALADTITVLRGGRTVATVDPKDVTPRQLAELMVGSELPTPETQESTVTDTVELSVTSLGVRSDDGRWVLRDVSLVVHRGEVVGIAGVEGNGQAELIEAILGLHPVAEGSIELAGHDITTWPTRDRREAGLGYIPEDRHRRGLLLPSPLWENAMLGRQGVAPYSNHDLLTPAGARRATEEIIEEFDVKTPGLDIPAHALSGGNQQKFIVGREMSSDDLKLLVAAHPTRGIDVGAQAAVWDQLRRARKEGLAVLLVSADLEELIGLSDTLHVIYRGRLVATLDPAMVTPADLGSYMTGVRTQEPATEEAT